LLFINFAGYCEYNRTEEIRNGKNKSLYIWHRCRWGLSHDPDKIKVKVTIETILKVFRALKTNIKFSLESMDENS